MDQRVRRSELSPRVAAGPVPQISHAANTGGAGAMAAASAIGDIRAKAAQIQEQRETVWAARESARMRERWVRRSFEMEQEAEDGAPGYAAALQAEFERERNELISSAPSDLARARIETSMYSLGGSLSDRALRFEAAERVAYRQDLVQDTFALDTNAILTSPDLAEAALGDAISMIEGMGLPAQAQRDLITTARSQYRSAELRGIIDRNPAAGYDALTSGRYDADLDPQAKSQLLQFAESRAFEQMQLEITEGGPEMARSFITSETTAAQRLPEIEAAVESGSIDLGSIDPPEPGERGEVPDWVLESTENVYDGRAGAAERSDAPDWVLESATDVSDGRSGAAERAVAPDWALESATDVYDGRGADRFVLDGLDIEYRFAPPEFPYGRSATAGAVPFSAIVIHHTAESTTAESTIRYGHMIDEQRGGAFGYHFIIGRDGSITQAAPLSARTNHAIGHGDYASIGNANAIGISLAGAGRDDGSYEPTPEQERAALALGRALASQYQIQPGRIRGHGEIAEEGHRRANEGTETAALLRGQPDAPMPEPAPRDSRYAFLPPERQAALRRAAERRLDAELARMAPEYEGMAAQLRDGRSVNPPTRAELVALWGVERGGVIADSLEDSARFGETMSSIRSRDGAQIAQLREDLIARLESASPEEYPQTAREVSAINEAIEAHYKALAEDPVEYLFTNDATGERAREAWRTAEIDDQPMRLGEYVDYAMDLQERAGVPEAGRRALSNGEAQAIAGMLVSQGRENLPAQMLYLRQGFRGRPDAWRSVIRDLTEQGGLGDDFRVLALHADDQAAYRLLSSGWNVSTEDAKAGLESGEATAVREAIDVGFRELGEVLLYGDASGEGVRQLNALRDLSLRAGYIRARQIDSGAAAEEVLAATISNRYAIMNDDRLVAYAPAGTDLDALADRVDDLLESDEFEQWIPDLDYLAEQYGGSAIAEAVYEALLQENARFITNSRGTGVELAIELNGAVTVPLGRNGKPLSLPFRDVPPWMVRAAGAPYQREQLGRVLSGESPLPQFESLYDFEDD